MKAKTVKGETLSDFESEFSAKTADGFAPNLVVLFASVATEAEEIIQFFEKKGLRVFAMTSSGEMCDDEVNEYSAVAMLLQTEDDSFELFAENKSEQEDFFGLGKRVAEMALSKFPETALMVHSGGLMNDGEAIVRGILAADNQVPIFGGLAGDDLHMQTTWAYADGKKIEGGIGVLAWNLKKVNCVGVASSGWKAVGIEKVITKSVGNIVYEIDGKNALDVIIENFKLPSGMSPSELVTIVGAQYPFHVYREDGSSVIRACMIVLPDGGLLFAGSVPQGAKVRFSVPPDMDIIQTSVAEVETLKEQINADCIFIYSCKARHLSLGPLIDHENTGIRQIWDAPLVGLFTYGEIGAKAGFGCDFHNETISVCLLSGKNA